MKQIAPRSLARNTRAATTLEFALVSVVLIAMLIGGIEVGIMMWTLGTVQAIAAQTARCAALASPLCNQPSANPPLTPKLYAFRQAKMFLGSGVVTNVTVAGPTSCMHVPVGTTTFEVVTITTSVLFGSAFTPLGMPTEKVTACYPI